MTQKQKAQALLDGGMTKRAIAAKLGVHPNAITKLGLRGSATQQRRDRARRLKQQGACNVEIAKQLGVHYTTVLAWVGK